MKEKKEEKSMKCRHARVHGAHLVDYFKGMNMQGLAYVSVEATCLDCNALVVMKGTVMIEETPTVIVGEETRVVQNG